MLLIFFWDHWVPVRSGAFVSIIIKHFKCHIQLISEEYEDHLFTKYSLFTCFRLNFQNTYRKLNKADFCNQLHCYLA